MKITRALVILMVGFIELASSAETADSDAGESHKSASPVAQETVAVILEVRKKDDKVQVSIKDDTLFVDAECPSGIGGVRISLPTENRPKKVVVLLRYTANKSFTHLEGPEASLEQKDKREEHLQVQVTQLKDGYEAEIPVSQRRTLHLHWIDAYRQ